MYWTDIRTPTSGVEFGTREQNRIKNIINEGSTETGILIELKASNTVQNITIANVHTYEQLQLHVTMQANDVITLSTYDNDVSCVLLRNDMQTNIFGAIDLESDFLKLHVGDNVLMYDADVGIDGLDMTIKHRNALVGV